MREEERTFSGLLNMQSTCTQHKPQKLTTGVMVYMPERHRNLSAGLPTPACNPDDGRRPFGHSLCSFVSVLLL